MAYVPSILEEMTMRTVLSDEEARKNEYSKQNEAYEGKLKPPLTKDQGEPNDNVRVNRIKPIISATVHFLFGTPPAWELPNEGDDAEAEPLAVPMANPADVVDGEIPAPPSKPKDPREEWLEECFRLNNWEAFLLKLGINGGVGGTPFARVDPSRGFDNEEDRVHPYPRFYVMDPATMRIVTNDDDIDQVDAYVWERNSVDPKTKKPIVRRQVIGRQDDGTWLITDQHTALNDAMVRGDWITDEETVWPYKWAPISHCQNLPAPNEVYGKSDITDCLIEGNKAINFNFSNRQKIDRLHGHPILWVVGLADGAFQRLKTAVGRFFGLPMGSTMGQLTPALNGEYSSQLQREIYEAMLEESGTPSITLGRATDDGNPSGVALRVRLWPMLMKTEVKRKLYGPLIVELIRQLFELGGWGQKVLVTLDWPEMVPVNMLEERQVALADAELGASEDTLLTKLGYDAAKEKLKRQAEDTVKAAQAMAMAGAAAGAGPGPGGSGGGGGLGSKGILPPTIPRPKAPAPNAAPGSAGGNPNRATGGAQ